MENMRNEKEKPPRGRLVWETAATVKDVSLILFKFREHGYAVRGDKKETIHQKIIAKHIKIPRGVNSARIIKTE